MNRVLLNRTWSTLFIILVGLTVTLFSEKMLIYTRCMRGFMPNLIKKSAMVSKEDLNNRKKN